MTSRRRTLPAVAVAAAVVLGACGGGGGPEEPAAPSRAVRQASATAAQSAASILRANLTTLLQGHVYLTGAATGSVVAGQDPAPALEVLDANSVALANVFGAVYGGDAAAQFLDVWRRHVALLVEFARASAAGDDVAVAAAKAGLDAYRDEMAVLLNTVNPHYATADVAEEQKGYLGALQSAITAQAKADPQAADKLHTAAEKMPRTATILVAGIGKDRPEQFPGRVDGSAATLRTVLTATLQDHVYLSWLAAGVVATAAEDDPVAKAVLAALEENDLSMSEIVGSAYGDDAARRFLGLWRTQSAAAADYARARAAGDTAGAQAAAATLVSEEPGLLGAFLQAANPNLDGQGLARALSASNRSLLAAIDAQVAGLPSRFAEVYAVAKQTPAVAATLSAGIASQFPSRFS